MHHSITRTIRELHQRYPGDGPRYTSYPTALELKKGFDSTGALALIRNSNEALVPNPLSLYLHLPFCRHLCFYCGCNRIVTKNRQRAAGYLDVLKQEVALVSGHMDADRQVLQLHLGGGTPSFYQIEELDSLLQHIRRHFRMPDNSERDYSIEIDPRTVTEDYLSGIADLGFNRISIGVQDFDTAVQEAIHRVQNGKHIARLMTAARSAGIQSINLDLVYGLPKQTLETFSKTLSRTVSLAPDRISIYQYAHMPQRFPAQRRILADDLPDRSQQFDLECAAIETLTAAHYTHIGMDHYARRTDRLTRALQAGTIYRNFQGYSTHASCDLIGFGVSAISDVGGGMYQNDRDLDGYYKRMAQGVLPVAQGLVRTTDDSIRQAVIREVMCEGEINMRQFVERFGETFDEYFVADQEILANLIDDGLLRRSEQSLRVTRVGRFLLRDIARAFDRYRGGSGRCPAPRALCQPNR